MNKQHAFIAVGNSMDNGVYREAIIDGSRMIFARAPAKTTLLCIQA